MKIKAIKTDNQTIMKMIRDKHPAIQEILGRKKCKRLSKARQDIINLLRSNKDGLLLKDISETLGKNYFTTKNTIRKMTIDGQVDNIRGIYLLPEEQNFQIIYE